MREMIPAAPLSMQPPGWQQAWRASVRDPRELLGLLGLDAEAAAVPEAAMAAFALRVRDESLVTTVPGDAFGPRGAGFLRVSLGGPVEELVEGLVRLAPWWEG